MASGVPPKDTTSGPLSPGLMTEGVAQKIPAAVAKRAVLRRAQRKGLALVCAAGLCALIAFTNCGESKSDQATAGGLQEGWIDLGQRPFEPRFLGGTLRVGFPAKAPETLNPLCASHQEWLMFHRGLLYPTLLTEGVDPKEGTKALVPFAAEALPTWEGESTLVFRLKAGLRWSGGEEVPVQARDYVAAFALLQHEVDWSARWRKDLAEVKAVRAIDERTIAVQLFSREDRLMTAVGLSLPVIPAHAASVDPTDFKRQTELPSFGPYEVSSLGPKALVLELRRPYERALHPIMPAYHRRIEFSFDDQASLEKAFVRGDLDIVGAGQTAAQRLVKEGPKGSRIYRYSLSLRVILAWSDRDPADKSKAHPILSDPRLRRALTMLLPLEKLAAEVFDRELIASTAPWPMDHSGTDPTIAPHPYAPEEAKALLDDLGWKRGDDGVRAKDGARLKLRFSGPTAGSPLTRFLERVAEALRQAGIDAESVAMESGLWLKATEQHDLEVTAFFVRPTDPFEDDPYSFLHSSQTGLGGSNWAGLKDARMDDLLERARATKDPSERALLRREIHRLWHELVPYSSPGSLSTVVVLGPKIANERIHSFGLRYSDLVQADRLKPRD